LVNDSANINDLTLTKFTKELLIL